MLADQIRQDFISFTPLIGQSTITHIVGGVGTSTTITLAQCNSSRHTYGTPEIAGYEIHGLSSLFLVTELAAEPRIGDTITRDGIIHEVTKVEVVRRDQLFRVYAERAVLNPNRAVTVDIERGEISLDAAKATERTWTAIYANQQAIVREDDNTSDIQARMGVRFDKSTLTFFLPQSLALQPTDRVKYNGRYYRTTYSGDQGKVSRLQYVKGELYA